MRNIRKAKRHSIKLFKSKFLRYLRNYLSSKPQLIGFLATRSNKILSRAVTVTTSHPSNLRRFKETSLSYKRMKKDFKATLSKTNVKTKRAARRILNSQICQSSNSNLNFYKSNEQYELLNTQAPLFKLDLTKPTSTKSNAVTHYLNGFIRDIKSLDFKHSLQREGDQFLNSTDQMNKLKVSTDNVLSYKFLKTLLSNKLEFQNKYKLTKKKSKGLRKNMRILRKRPSVGFDYNANTSSMIPKNANRTR